MEILKRPIIGVLVNNAVIRKLKHQNKNLKSYARLLELSKSSAEAGVTVYYFSVHNYDLKRGRMLGTYYDDKKEKWLQKEFPLPDVLYNRRAGGDGHFRASRIEHVLDQRKVLKVNSKSYFNKWEVYRDLSKSSRVSKYLPYTKKYKDERDLSEFLEEYEEAYLKGERGGRGEWVLRVRKRSEGKYEYSYFTDRVVSGEVSSWHSLMRAVRKFFGNRPFVMQKVIDLIRIDDRNVDFRAELQRDGKGKLNIIGVCARIGKNNSPITIHSSAYPLDVFLDKYMNYSDDEIEEMTERVNKFLVSIYEELEEAYGEFGEIGLDFGLDRKGKIWFIEPNSKSAKVSLMKAYDKKTFHAACANPLFYAKRLYQKVDRKGGKRTWFYRNIYRTSRRSRI